MDSGAKKTRPVTDIFIHLIKKGGELAEQLREIRQIAVGEGWGKDEISEVFRSAKATASQSATLCQHLLILLVEAGAASGNKNLAGSVALEAGNLLESLGVAEGALAFQLTAAEAFKECDAPDLRALALVNAGHGLVQHFGEFSRALECYHEALPHFQENMAPAHVADVLLGMGHALKGLNRFEEAIERYESARRLDPAIHSLDIYIGECFRHLGRSRDAIARHARCTTELPPAAFDSLYSLANDYLTAGRWEEALQTYKRALLAVEGQGESEAKAKALLGISNCYQETNRQVEAEACVREAYDVAVSLNDNRLGAFCLDALAHILLIQHNRPAAREAARQAVDLARQSWDRNLEVRLWGNLGIALASSDPDALKEAIKAYEHGLALARKVGDTSEEARITALLGHTKQGASWLSMFVKDSGLGNEAPPAADRERDLESAIKAAEKRGDPRSLQQALSFAGTYYEVEKQDWNKAAACYARAIDLRENFLANVEALEDQRGATTSGVSDYASIIHCCLRSGELERAWWYVERGRARSLLRMISNANSQRPERTAPSLEEQLDSALADFRTVRATDGAQIARDIVVEGVPPEKQDRRRILESLLFDLRKQSPAAAALREVTIEPADSLQALIPEGVAVIEYYLMPALVLRNEMAFAFVITAKRISAVDLKTTAHKLDELVRSFRSVLLPVEMEFSRQHQRPDSSRSPVSWEKLSRDLYRMLITPVLPLLGDSKSLWIVPSGPLHYLPFSALRSERYLIEDFALSYLPSANTLRFLKPWTPGEVKRVAAFANPDCGNAAFDLPGATREASLIRLNGRTPDCWERSGATKENVLLAFETHDVVHLACHASFNIDHPLQSFLQLASSEPGLGRWQLREILNGSIRASMVVLSACTSSYAEVSPGEEILSLAYAFLHAGSSTLVGSLWKVSDDACPLLMQSYYEQLSTEHAAMALRNAQLFMIRSATFGHPRFWAAFQVVGIADHTAATRTGQPDGADARFQRLKEKGIHAAENGAHADALRHLTAAIELRPGDTDVWDLCGGVQRMLGNLKEAHRCFQEALVRGRKDFSFLIRLGDTSQSLKLYAEAEKHYLEALKSAPTDAVLLTRLADLVRKQGRAKECVEYADRALSIDPKAAEALAVKAIACYQLEQLDQTIDLGRQALAVGYESPHLHLALATALMPKLQIREARRHALICLRNDFEVEHVREILRFLRKLEQEHGPQDIAPDISKAMRQAKRALGKNRPADALEHFKRACDLAPESALAWSNYGALLGMTGNVSAAKDCLQKSVKLDETDPDAWFNLAQIHANLQELVEAAGCVRKALEIDDEFVRALVLHGQLLMMDDKIASGFALIEKAARLAPDDAQIADLVKGLRRFDRGKR